MGTIRVHRNHQLIGEVIDLWIRNKYFYWNHHHHHHLWWLSLSLDLWREFVNRFPSLPCRRFWQLFGFSLIHRLFLYLTIRQWDEEDGDSGEEFLYFCSLSDDKVLRWEDVTRPLNDLSVGRSVQLSSVLLSCLAMTHCYQIGSDVDLLMNCWNLVY